MWRWVLTTSFVDINNVGAISQSLFAYNNPNYDEVKAAQWQATQVSTVSLMNCLGRILIGERRTIPKRCPSEV